MPEQGDGVVDIHYARTGYAYDAAGRRNENTAPGGTIAGPHAFAFAFAVL